MSDPIEPIALAAAVLIYSIMRWRMQRVVQPLRMRMVECGHRLLDDPSVPARTKSVVSWMLDTAFSSRLFLTSAIVAVPFAAVMVAFGYQAGWISEGLSDQARKEANRVNFMHSIIIFANHPLLSAVLAIEVAVFALLAALMKLLYGGALPRMFGPLDFVEALTSRMQRVHHLKPSGA